MRYLPKIPTCSPCVMELVETNAVWIFGFDFIYSVAFAYQAETKSNIPAFLTFENMERRSHRCHSLIIFDPRNGGFPII